MLPTPSSPPAERVSEASADAGEARPSHSRVLVLLAAHNGAPWIREQVDSILAQQDIDVRLVIRDDGSTDQTLRELDPFAGNGGVSIVQRPVPAGSAAGNFLALIRENPADGAQFVAFADQDDVWDRDKLSRARRIITADASAGYSSATIATWEDGRQRTLRPSGAQTSSDYLFEGAGQGCTFVLTAALYERVRALIVQHRDLTQALHYHDWAVYALARAWALRWSFDPQPSMRYRQHAGNDTGARGSFAGIAKRFALIRRGWYRTQLVAIAELCTVAAPTDAMLAAWRSQLMQPDGWSKRWQTARFCLRAGRRRGRDKAMVAVAALAGWI